MNLLRIILPSVLGLGILLNFTQNSAVGQNNRPAVAKGFVYLRDIDASILQDIRYAGQNNFVGAALPGYEAGECLLVREAAKALKKVQDDLKKQDLSLKVYDCYRPARAVAAFGKWAQNSSTATRNYYPRIEKTQLFRKGYIAKRSDHSRGIAIDLTLVRLPVMKIAPFEPSKKYGTCIEPKEMRSPDTSVDMGTGYDCFDVRSHTWNKQIEDTQRGWRRKLVSVMEKFGFENYKNEWWHFSYRRKHYPKTYYDFPVKPIQ